MKEIFADAGSLSEAERAGFVYRAAGGDQDIQREVLRLLRLDPGAEEWLLAKQPDTQIVQAAVQLHAFYPGQVLAARYEILRFIAAGGMGEVYEAEDRQLGLRIAIKTVLPELTHADHLAWLKREVQTAHRIRHPNVSRIFDLVQTAANGRPVVFLTMEFLEGETLSEKLRREGPWTERRALPVIRQIVAGLHAAHKAGVVHRDLKSGNVMIVPREDGSPRAVVMDFGLARPAPRDPGASSRSMSGRSLSSGGFGTPAYMAPEQIEAGEVGPAADIYALGVIVYEMVTGELPYAGESPIAMLVKKMRGRPTAPDSLAPTLRPMWSAAILKCIETKPARRFGDVRQMLEHLETRTRSGLWWKLARRRYGRWLRSAAAASAVSAIAAVGWWLWPAEPHALTVADWEQGVFDLQAGEPMPAARRLEHALTQHRLPPVAHAYLALAWHESGFDARASAELAAARRKPFQSQQDVLFTQAVELQLQGRRDQAREALLRRIAGNPDTAALADLALLEDQMGRAEAEDRWKEVVRRSPNHPAALLRLAMLHARGNRWKEAEREFLMAETYFQAFGDAAMLRVVSARRGLARIGSGDVDMARFDLPSLMGFHPRLPGTGYGPCERSVALMAGEPDNFALPVDPVPSVNPDFVRNPLWPKDGRTKQFDEARDNEYLFASFLLPAGVRFCTAQVEIHIRKERTGYQNGLMHYGVAPFPEEQTTTKLRPLWTESPDSNERVLTDPIGPDFLLDVQRAQYSRKATFLDFMIQDDTTVDYIKLTLVY